LLQGKQTSYLLVIDSMSLSWFCSTSNCTRQTEVTHDYHITSSYITNSNIMSCVTDTVVCEAEKETSD